MREPFGLIANLLPRFRHKASTKMRRGSPIVPRNFNELFYGGKESSDITFSFSSSTPSLAMDIGPLGASSGVWLLLLGSLSFTTALDICRSGHLMPSSTV